MSGEPGDPVVYIDKSGEENEGIIQRMTMEGNATIVFFENSEFERENAAIAFNIPLDESASTDRRVYRTMDEPGESELTDALIA